MSLDTGSPYSVSLSFLTDTLHYFSLVLICNHIPVCISHNHCERAKSLENVHCNPTTKPYQSRHLLHLTVTSLYEFSVPYVKVFLRSKNKENLKIFNVMST